MNQKKSEAELSNPSTHISELTQLGSPSVFQTRPVICVTHDQRVGF